MRPALQHAKAAQENTSAVGNIGDCRSGGEERFTHALRSLPARLRSDGGTGIHVPPSSSDRFLRETQIPTSDSWWDWFQPGADVPLVAENGQSALTLLLALYHYESYDLHNAAAGTVAFDLPVFNSSF